MPVEVRPGTPEEFEAVRALLMEMRDCSARHGACDAEYTIQLRGRSVRRAYRVFHGETTIMLPAQFTQIVQSR